MTVMYESGLSGAFMYMWGYHDAQHQVPVPPGLLLNAQNGPKGLDYLLGDLFGATTPNPAANGLVPTYPNMPPQRRWFIAELKQDRGGFFNEVHASSAKPHRSALYAHLRTDQACRDLARFGHFAIWRQNEGIVSAPYSHTIGPGAAGGPGPGLHELDHNSFIAAFDRFYAHLNEPDMNAFTGNTLLFGQGLGLPIEGMRRYLACMLQYCVPLPNTPALVSQASDELLFGYVNPGGGAVLAKGSFEHLLVACATFIKTVAPPYATPKHQ